jgi:hypothetical protein
MESKPTLSDLLDIRDGEFADPQLAAQILEDPEARAALASLTGLKAGLRALPGIEPDPAMWEAIQRRRRRAWWRRFPLATAATVFLAATLTVVWWNPMGVDQDVAEPQLSAPSVSDPVAELLLRSQRLESALLRSAALTESSASERALLYGIADVDARLSALYESGEVDPEARERLWRQRVMLLESLADEQRGRAVLRPAIY